MIISRCTRLCQNIIHKHQHCALTRVPSRNGYIVLLPEVSKDVTEKLLQVNADHINFTDLDIKKCENTINNQFIDFECGIHDIEDYLNSVENGKYDLFKDVLEPIENLSHKFDKIWAVLKTLYLADMSVMPARIYYPIHNKACMSHTTKYNSKPIYEACKKADLSKLTEEQVAVVNKFIKEGKLNGLELEDKLYYSFKANKQKCSTKQKYYKIRLEMAWSQFQHIIDNPQLVKEFPEDLLTLMAVNKDNPKKRPWKVSLAWGTADRFIEYCPDRDIRWNVWQAYEKAASPADDTRELNNGLEVEEIRKLRLEAAEKLGFKNYGELSLTTKMAPSISVIENTLMSILEKARPLQDKEIESLQDFSKKQGNEYPIQLWDVGYWARLQKKELYGYDEVSWSEYFPLDKVLDGLFELCKRLYGIRILETQYKSNLWHPDVKYYEILREDEPNIVAGFYLDLCSRPQKMKTVGEPGWLVTHRTASSIPKRVLPLSALIMNLPSTQNKNPSLLSFTQVKTLFGKFGHLLQNVLCQVHYSEVSGLTNVEWDAIGITSNFMIHWLYDKETFDSINSHYKTGKRLPNDQLTEIKQHMAGFNTCEELFKSMIDIKLHTTKTHWNDLVKEIWNDCYGFPLSKWNSFPCRFSEVMSNEQGAANYYSALWSKIIAADVFQSFIVPDESVKNSGLNFRDTFFAFGGSCPTGEIFRRFKGRDPNTKAFISDLGLDKDSNLKKFMSYRTYNELWAQAQLTLDEATKNDSNLLTSKVNKDKTVVFKELSIVMVNYISAINKLNECYDQVIQPQKRILIRKILELSLGRYLELKNDMINLNFNEFTYLDFATAQMKLLPQDVKLTIPSHYRNERCKTIEWQSNFIDEVLKKTGFYEEEKVEIDMPIRQAILLIQRHERARQGRMRAQFMKEVRAMNKPDAGDVELSDNARKAAMKIQRVWRGFITRRKIRSRVVEEMLLIGMLPPNTIDTEEQQKAEEVKSARRIVQVKRQKEYELALIQEKEKIRDHTKEKMKEDIRDEVRAWYMGVKSQTGKFPDLPTEESGGSAVIYTRYKTASSLSKSTSQSSSKGTKSHKSKSISGKESKEEKKKKIEEEDDGFKMGPSNFLQELMLANSEYEEVWKGMDETKNSSQKHIETIVKAQKVAEVEQELRKIVDIQLRIELETLQNSLDKDNAIRVKRSKKQKKVKRSNKKAKKKRDKDLTPDRTLESLYEELVMNGVIHKYPLVSLRSFNGDMSYAGCDVMRWDNDPSPTLGDVRQAVRDYCVLPMLSQEIHQASPTVRSVLIAGTRGSGKHRLVNAVCTELGATLFDLTAANIVGKYPGKSGLTMLLHLVNKVARLLQPSVIFIEDAEKTFMKKVPKTDKTDPKRLKKDLPKLVKAIAPTDRILLLGISRCPWDCDQKSLISTYGKIIVIPRPDYASLYHIWNDLLFQYSGLSRKFDVSSLAKLSDGYSVGTIIKVLQEVMTCKRVLQLTIRPLMHVEILNALARHDPIYREEEDMFNQWYSRTPLGRRKQKALDAEVERRMIENEKHSGAK